MKYLILVAISLPIALSGSLARDYGMANGVMGQGMQGCVQMMQGMNGRGRDPPNEQWRRGQVAPGGEKPGLQSRGRSSAE